MKRRKLGSIISEPIMNLLERKRQDSLIFVEMNHEAALKTRAAALMFIGRNDLGLKTAVKDNEIWIMKDKDNLGRFETEDLREE